MIVNHVGTGYVITPPFQRQQQSLATNKYVQHYLVAALRIKLLTSLLETIMINKSHKIGWDELLQQAYVWSLNDIKGFLSRFFPVW